jgi:hypothetical protein
MRSAKIALAGGLALTAFAIGIVLSRAPLLVAGTNGVATGESVVLLAGDAGACQPAGTVPAGTTAIRLALETVAVGPRVSVKVRVDGRVLTEGERASGWGISQSVTVPVKRVSRTASGATLCTGIGPLVEPLGAHGTSVNPGASAGHSLADIDVSAEYLRPGSSSWLSRASTIASNMGVGNATGGAWIAVVLVAAMVAVTALIALQALRDPMSDALRRIPRTAWTCALVAILNAACWSFITPPFQAIDEPTHFAYTQQIAENFRLPTSSGQEFSEEETDVLLALHQPEIRGAPEVPAVYTPETQQALNGVLDAHLSRRGTGAVGGSYNDPPLYYMIETIPYGLASAGTLFDQLAAMRLLSCLFAGLTALFVFLFVRETLPATRWAWAVAGLAVAAMPLLASMSGAMNPDAMLFAVSAATFYCLARAFRRGLTRRLAVALGCLAAVGLLTELNFVGLVPGVAIGLCVLAARASRAQGRRAATVSLALALGIAASPAIVYAVANALSNRPALGVVSTTLGAGTGGGSLLGKLSFVWQLYLPPLPGMTHYFPGLSSSLLWFDRSVGFYGWLDTLFPPWVDTVGLVPAAILALLSLRGLVLVRARLPARLAEVGVYAAMSVGLMVLIGGTSYLSRNVEGLGGFFEPRYLLPLLPLFAVALALAARGAGRRWGPAVGSLIVVLFLAHDLFSQLLVVSRFYR